MSCYEVFLIQGVSYLTLSYRRYLLYRTRSIDLLCKSMDWFLYVRDLPHEKLKGQKHDQSGILDFSDSHCLTMIL